MANVNKSWYQIPLLSFMIVNSQGCLTTFLAQLGTNFSMPTVEWV